MNERTAPRSRTPSYGRALRLALALLVGATLFAPFAAAGPSGPKLCGTDRGGWESIDVPFPVGSQSIKSWSISQTTIPMFATNGLAVMRSQDRGCSWDQVFRLDDVPEPGTTVTSVESVIEQVHVSESPLAPGKVFVTVDQLEPVSRPRIFVSTDSGESFSPSERGLEGAVGRPEDLATSPSNPGSVYLLTDTSGIQRSLLPDGLPEELSGARGVAQALYESIDGGRTWQPTQSVYPGDPWNGIEVDPADSDQVWLYGDTGAALATPATAQQPQPVPGPISYVDVWHQPGQPARVLATTADGPEVYRSNTGGSDFIAKQLPGIAQSVVGLGPIQEVYATSTGVYSATLGRKAVNQSPADGRPILDLYLTDGAGTELWGRSDTTIERRVFRPPTTGRFDLCKQAARLGFTPEGCAPELDVEVPCVEAPRPGETALAPERLELALEPGQKKTVHYDFKVPTRGQLLDVFFLIDVSGSMQDAIDGTGRAMSDIVTSLRNKGINVQFGVGEYRSYTNPPVYRRVLDITNDCGAVEEALESLIASGGGDETQLEALYQVARGESRPGVNVVVPAGQDASFRAASTRIIIHTTDEPISEGPPNPSYEEVAEALNSEDIAQVGVAIEDGFGSGGGLGDRPPPSEGLAKVATMTGTLAEDGVDCNGDGDAEILAGEPLVCKISPLRARSASAMAPAITNLVQENIADPKVSYASTPDSPVILEGPPRGVFEEVDDPRYHGFDVTYQCPQLHSRKRFTAEIKAAVDGVTESISTATVVCKVPPKPEPKLPLPFVALPVVPFLPPPPAPPEIPPAPNPNPNPQPNPQSQAQAQAQGAMAHQEQQQPQLAYVHAQAQRAAAAAQESAGGKETEYAMSSYSKDSDGVPPEAIFMIGAMTMSAAFGCLTLAREKVRVQHVRR